MLLFVLDARDPMGTRIQKLEKEIRKTRPGKHIVLLLNKVDLIPTWCARRWVQILTKEFPTLAFHASITNPFGKNALLNLLRQFGVLIKERKHLTIGMIGYPNVGKSSVINTMRHKKVCKAAPIPGETKVWQYIALTKKLYMLDCPGIVPPTTYDFDADCAKVLRGVVRPERILDPSAYIDEVLSRVKRPYLLKRYKLPLDTDWEGADEFLTILANKMGKLRKGGDPDLEITARMVLMDWQRGRLPFFTPPPEAEGAGDEDDDDEPEADAAASSSTAAPVEGASTADENALKGPVRQSLAELACTMEFDEEDRRGDALPVQTETNTERKERKEEEAEDKTWQGRRKKRKAEAAAAAAGGGAKEAEADGEAAGSADANPPRKKKKIKRGGGGGQGQDKSKEKTQEGGMAVRQGSMDWKAVVAEFDM